MRFNNLQPYIILENRGKSQIFRSNVQLLQLNIQQRRTSIHSSCQLIFGIGFRYGSHQHHQQSFSLASTNRTPKSHILLIHFLTDTCIEFRRALFSLLSQLRRQIGCSSLGMDKKASHIQAPQKLCYSVISIRQLNRRRFLVVIFH